MSYPIAQLKKLLNTKAVATTGVVVGMSKGVVTVATSSGARSVNAAGILRIGDRVALNSDVAVKMSAVAGAQQV